MNCTFNNSKIDINSITKLTELIKCGERNQYNEIWLSDEKTALTILTNKAENKAFLMFLNLETDRSYTPFYMEKSSEQYIRFLLSNGQMDEYSINCLVDIELIGKVILEYYKNKQMWSGISWKEN